MSTAARSNATAEIAFCSLMCHLMLWMAFNKCPRARLLQWGSTAITAKAPVGPSPGQQGGRQCSSSPACTLQWNLTAGITSPSVRAYFPLKSHDESSLWMFQFRILLCFHPPLPLHPQCATHGIIFRRRRLEGEMFISNPAFLIMWILTCFIWISLLDQLGAYTSLGDCHEREQQRLWWWMIAAKSFSSPLSSAKILSDVHQSLS